MIIIDDFVKDSNLLTRIEHDDTFFGENGNFMWWDGWWNTEAHTLKQELIEYVWKYRSPWDHPRYQSINNLMGFEYWTGVYGDDKPNKNLGWHFDKDEKHWLNTGGNDGGEVISPIIGTIYYPKKSEFTGGYLEIQSAGDDGPAEVIEPKFNRLIIFDAGKHKHRVTEVKSGLRYAIAINLWQTSLVGLDTNDFTIE